MKTGVLIMFPKSRAVLAREWRDQSETLDRRYKAMWQSHELLKAALAEDDDELAKIATAGGNGDVALAKIEAAAIKAQNSSLFIHTGRQLIDWLNEMNKALDNHLRETKKSEMFFARLGR